ncbi:MAG: hypothetical protein QNL61_02195 [Crocinitomicaceae bacterium]
MKITLIFLLFVFATYGQEPSRIEEKKNASESAQAHLREFKRGFLLVRLADKKKEIEYYNKYENFDEAKRIQENQDKINDQIRIAFDKYFTMCIVYYFNMSDTRKLLDEQFDAIKVYDVFGVEVPNVDLSTGKFYIAEFGIANQDEVTNDENVNDGEYNERMAVSALVIRTNTLLELRDPFPYFVRYNIMGGLKSRYLGPVKKMQEKLSAFGAY